MQTICRRNEEGNQWKAKGYPAIWKQIMFKHFYNYISVKDDQYYYVVSKAGLLTSGVYLCKIIRIRISPHKLPCNTHYYTESLCFLITCECSRLLSNTFYQAYTIFWNHNRMLSSAKLMLKNYNLGTKVPPPHKKNPKCFKSTILCWTTSRAILGYFLDITVSILLLLSYLVLKTRSSSSKPLANIYWLPLIQ